MCKAENQKMDISAKACNLFALSEQVKLIKSYFSHNVYLQEERVAIGSVLLYLVSNIHPRPSPKLCEA